VQGHISGVVDVPNACATLYLPTEIFDFDIMPSSAGPIKHIKAALTWRCRPINNRLGERVRDGPSAVPHRRPVS